MILESREKGCYLEDIAKDTGCSVSMVKRALKQQGPPACRRSGVPQTALMKFSDVVDEVLEQFVAKTGVDVSISVEINAKAPAGFDEALQRVIKENCNVLGFSSAEFEE